MALPTISLGQANWGINGNVGTATSFLGNTNNFPLVFKVNNVQVGSFGNLANSYIFTVNNSLTVNSITTTAGLRLSSFNAAVPVRLLQMNQTGFVTPFTMGTVGQYLNGAGTWQSLALGATLISTDANGNILPFALSTANKYLDGTGAWQTLPTNPTNAKLLSTTNTGATQAFVMSGNANEYLAGNGAWTNLPTPPTQYFTSPSANNIATTNTLTITPNASQQYGILLNTQTSNVANATAVQTSTKDNQYAITNTATYLDDNGTPVTAQTFSVTSRGTVDATEYTRRGVALGMWNLLGQAATGGSYLSHLRPVSIGTTNSPAQSLSTFVNQNTSISTTAGNYFGAQLLNMEGNDPTMIFRDNITTTLSPEKADLLIGAANGAARFVTNNGFAFFMNADNNSPTASSFNGFKILKETPFFTTVDKEVLALQPDGEFTLRGNTIFGSGTDNRLMQVSNAGVLFAREFSIEDRATGNVNFKVKNTGNIAIENNEATITLTDNIANGGIEDYSNLDIKATNGAARFITNDGFAFFMNADNADTKGFFSLNAKNSSWDSPQVPVLSVDEDGVLNLYAKDATTKAIRISDRNDNFKINFGVDGNGFVYAREVNVYTTGILIPDYVFDKTYKLRTLAEVESYITTNKHLPNIPSAKEIQDKGTLSLTEMNLKLLEKVEELTLYMIEQNKKVEAQNKRIEELEKLK